MRISDWSSDVCSSDLDNPGLLYYYDAATGALDRLAAINEAIGGKRLSRARLVQYKARDGHAIEAVLTMPRGRAAKGLPRSDARRGGEECGSKCRSRWSECH